MYNAESGTLVSDEGLTEEIRNRYEDVMESLIAQAISQNSPRYDCINFLVRFLAFGLIIFGIVALATGNPNTA